MNSTIRHFIAACSFALCLLTASFAFAQGTVDVNTATASELVKLPGVGKVTAQRIIEYRQKNGPFKTVDDLTGVKGIGKGTLSKMRDKVVVGGAPAGGGEVSPVKEASKGGDDVIDLRTGDKPKAKPSGGKASQDTGGAIDLNTASAKELTSLPGIGKSKAQAIVDFRSANGNFTSVDGLAQVRGIGKKTVEKLRPFLTVSK